MFEFKNYDVLRILDGEDNITYGMLLTYPDESDPTIIYKQGFDRLSEIRDDIIAVARPEFPWELSYWDDSDLWRDRIVYSANNKSVPRPTNLITELVVNDIVETRDGSIGRICYDDERLYIIFSNVHKAIPVSDYDNRLIELYGNRSLDIVKIARPRYIYDNFEANYKYVLSKSDRIIWEEK